MLRAPSARQAPCSFSYSSSETRKLTSLVRRLKTGIALPERLCLKQASLQCPPHLRLRHWQEQFQKSAKRQSDVQKLYRNLKTVLQMYNLERTERIGYRHLSPILGLLTKLAKPETIIYM